jgi:hypothetical protein
MTDRIREQKSEIDSAQSYFKTHPMLLPHTSHKAASPYDRYYSQQLPRTDAYNTIRTRGCIQSTNSLTHFPNSSDSSLKPLTRYSSQEYRLFRRYPALKKPEPAFLRSSGSYAELTGTSFPQICASTPRPYSQTSFKIPHKPIKSALAKRTALDRPGSKATFDTSASTLYDKSAENHELRPVTKPPVQIIKCSTQAGTFPIRSA